MIAALRRTFMTAMTLVVFTSSCAYGQLIRYQAAIRSLADGAATFRSVEALPALGRDVAARAFAAGSYSRQFRIGTDARTVVSRNAEDGIIVAIEQATVPSSMTSPSGLMEDWWSEEPFSTRRPSNGTSSNLLA